MDMEYYLAVNLNDKKLVKFLLKENKNWSFEVLQRALEIQSLDFDILKLLLIYYQDKFIIVLMSSKIKNYKYLFNVIKYLVKNSKINIDKNTFIFKLF